MAGYLWTSRRGLSCPRGVVCHLLFTEPRKLFSQRDCREGHTKHGLLSSVLLFGITCLGHLYANPDMPFSQCRSGAWLHTSGISLPTTGLIVNPAPHSRASKHPIGRKVFSKSNFCCLYVLLRHWIKSLWRTRRCCLMLFLFKRQIVL